MLKWTAKCLSSNIRKTDSVCRLSGDEFVVICTHTDLNEGVQVAEKLQEVTKCKNFEEMNRWTPSLSIGVATISTDTNTANKLLNKADQRMYCAKKGPNDVCFLD